MAAPTYDTDLTLIHEMENTTNVSAIGGGASGLSAGIDFAIQGTNSVAKKVTGVGVTKGILADNTSGITMGADDHVFIWVYSTTQGVLDTIASGGIRVAIGTATSAFNDYFVAGSDTYTKGGHICWPIRYETTTPDPGSQTGTPGANPQYFGGQLTTIGTIKADDLAVDVSRYGTGAYVTVGDGVTPATFLGFASDNDLVANQWGILTIIPGGFALQGRFVVGQNSSQVATACTFKDSDVNIVFTDTPHSLSDFTQIIIDHASTTFEVSNLNLTTLGKNNKGKFIINSANPTIDIIGGTWTDIGELTTGTGNITFRSNSTLDSLILRNCSTFLSVAATVNNCTFESVLGQTVIDTAIYSGNSFLLSGEDASPNSIKFNNDGTKFFTTGNTNNTVYEYTVSTGFDLSSTVAYSGNSFSVSSEESGPFGIAFNSDGTKFFIVGGSSDTLFEYTVSTGFDLSSTVAYSGNSFSVSSEDILPQSVCFNSDGTKFFIVGTSTDTVYEYTVSTGFDLSSTVAYSGNSFSVNTQESTPTSICFNSDGTKFFIVGLANNTVYEYTVSTGFDLSSTVAYSGNSFSVSSEETTTHGLVLNPNDTKFFITGESSTRAHEYSIFDENNILVETADLEDLTKCNFISTGTRHAVELSSLGSGTMSWDNTLTGFATADGSTGNEAIFVNVGSGTLTINVESTADTPSIRTAGAVITVQNSPNILKIIMKDPDGSLITDSSVNVLIEAAAGGSLAVGTDIIKGFTDINGEIEDSRSYATNQPFTGWARKSSGTPFYRQSLIAGTVVVGTDLTLEIQMVADE